AGGYWLYHRDMHLPPAVSPPLAGLTVKASGRSALECINKGNVPQRVHLVDGSLIILGGNSSLHYEKFLQKDKREVYLDGEAFFDIAADAARPFYVHTRGVLTRVLGTSFRIIARKEDKKTIVAVRAGKVVVCAEHPGFTNSVPEYILQANQEVVFDTGLRATGKMPVTDTGLVAKPDLPEESLSFSDVPVSTVFRKLSDIYSVKIVYDEQQLSKCLITVSLDALSFEEKLALVCKVLGVQYREEDYQIVIEGKGCQ
ncbi:MAG TPA: FecR family protein, partial [Puia sp.]|nr:FecR family protein [Puia sp.]